MSDESANEAPESESKPEPKGTFARWKAKLEAHLAEYGAIALVVYVTIWLSVWAGFAIAIAAGFDVDVGDDSVGAGTWGTILAAYVPTKLTQPLRIAVTLVVTPVVAAVWHKIRGTKHVPKAERDAKAAKAKADDEEPDEEEPSDEKSND